MMWPTVHATVRTGTVLNTAFGDIVCVRVGTGPRSATMRGTRWVGGWVVGWAADVRCGGRCLHGSLLKQSL